MIKNCLRDKNCFLYLFIIFIGLFCFNNESHAYKASGYIITEKSDTIYGTVQVSRFDQLTGGFLIFGIELESFHSRVVFKGKNDKRFCTYFPEMISGFGFRFQTINYSFRRFKIPYRSIFDSEREQFRFLCLIQKGNIELYKEISFVENLYATTTHERYLTSYNYFLYSPEKGLLKVEMNNQFKSIRDVLNHFEMNDQFIKTIPYDTKFNILNEILFNYDRWLSMNAK